MSTNTGSALTTGFAATQFVRLLVDRSLVQFAPGQTLIKVIMTWFVRALSCSFVFYRQAHADGV